jgi:hypothetical protein
MEKNLKKIINMVKYYHKLKKLSFYLFSLNFFNQPCRGYIFFGLFANLINKLSKNLIYSIIIQNYCIIIQKRFPAAAVIFFLFFVDLFASRR